jgi:hypothetical protein
MKVNIPKFGSVHADCQLISLAFIAMPWLAHFWVTLHLGLPFP